MWDVIRQSIFFIVLLNNKPFDLYSYLKKLFIKPGIQERGTECGECVEHGECSLGFRGIS